MMMNNYICSLSSPGRVYRFLLRFCHTVRLGLPLPFQNPFFPDVWRRVGRGRSKQRPLCLPSSRNISAGSWPCALALFLFALSLTLIVQQTFAGVFKYTRGTNAV